MLQLILHLVGDYLTQSDWMAQNKTKAFPPACCHALVYSLPFLFVGSPLAVLVIFTTHLLIDRYRLARYVVWIKNHLGPRSTYRIGIKMIETVKNGYHAISPVETWEYRRWLHPWSECSATGYHKDVPAWLGVWLMIVADNTLHLAINYASLAWF